MLSLPRKGFLFENMESQVMPENTDTIAAVPSRTSFTNTPIFNKIKNLKLSSVLLMVSAGAEKIKNKASNITANIFNNFRNPENKNFLLPAIFAVVVVIILGAFLYFGRSGTGIVGSTNEKPAPSIAKKTKVINKEIEFPIRDGKGNEVSKLKYRIESAQLYDSFIVKGQRARAVQGRTFIILNLKLNNQYTQEIQIKTSDYVRLSVNNKNEFLAPDIHNDPVAVQPISTKYTRIGFAINETDKNLRIRVGEITGKKEEISIKF